jgi:hypothetical protein
VDERAWDGGKLAELGLGREARRGREGKAEEGDKRGFKKWGRGAAPRCAEPGWWGGLALCRGGSGRGEV